MTYISPEETLSICDEIRQDRQRFAHQRVIAQPPAKAQKPQVQWSATNLAGQKIVNRCFEDGNAWASRLNVRDGISGAEQDRIAEQSEAMV